MSEQELRKIIEDSGVLALYLRQMPSLTQYTLDSGQDIERYKKDIEAKEQNNFHASVYHCAFDIAMWIAGVGGSFSSLHCMTPESHKNTFSNHNFARLQSTLQDIRQEIEKLKIAKQLLSKLIDANAKTNWESCYMITLGTPNKSLSWRELDWNSHQKKIESKLAVLDLAILLYGKILATYDAEIADRTKSPKVKEIVKDMTSLVNQAEKVLQTIVKANEKAQKALTQGTRPDIKSCKAYIEESTKFNELSYEFSVCKNQLDYYINVAPNDVSFPALTSSSTSAESEIKKEWRRFA
jgi:hypothetical protein